MFVADSDFSACDVRTISYELFTSTYVFQAKSADPLWLPESSARSLQV